jgi:signal transduction histidine kinase
VHHILEAAHRVGTITRHILTFAAPKGGEVLSRSARAVLDGGLVRVAGAIEHAGVTIEDQVPQDLPDIPCHGDRLSKAIANVIQNALDAGASTIRLSAELTRRGTAELVRLTIEDQGEGISQANLGRVFDPFFSTRPRDAYAGLGLTVALGFAREHGGDLLVDSRPGGPTRVTLVMPAGAPDASQPQLVDDIIMD